MKRSIKVLTSFIAVFFLAVLTVFMINATDEKQTELTQQMLQKFPAQEGFSLKEFKLPKEERVPSVYLEKYSDYIKDQEKYDALILKYEKSLATNKKAFSIGRAAVNPDETFYDAVFFYPPSDHRLFLAFLSQEIKHGKVTDALKQLEQSNHFLVSLAGTPQTIIAKLISLATLKRNAEFAKDLIATGVVKKIPDSLKESFSLIETPEQMWDESSRKEFQLVSTIILGPIDSDMASAFMDDTTTLSGRFRKSILDWFYPKLIRRNQTLNMLSSAYAALSSPECLKHDSKECTYFENTTKFTVSNFFVNPLGRGLLKLFLPKFQGVRYKFQISTTALKDLVATL